MEKQRPAPRHADLSGTGQPKNPEWQKLKGRENRMPNQFSDIRPIPVTEGSFPLETGQPLQPTNNEGTPIFDRVRVGRKKVA